MFCVPSVALTSFLPQGLKFHTLQFQCLIFQVCDLCERCTLAVVYFISASRPVSLLSYKNMLYHMCILTIEINIVSL